MPVEDIFSKEKVATLNEPVLLLAPMQGITNPIFREALINIGGMNLVATEFVRISQENQNIVPIKRHSIPLQIQLMASNPTVLAGGLQHLLNNGTIKEDDWLDLNAGCPAKRVNSRGAGAALLSSPEKLLEMILAIRSVWNAKLSIKIRLGIKNALEFSEILDALKSAPIDFITIHAKTREDALNSEATINKEALKEASRGLPYPVIGNGDLWNAQDGINLVRECNLRGVMFGRPAVANPFIFNEFRTLWNNGQLESESIRCKMMQDFIQQHLKKVMEQETSEHSLIGAWKELTFWFARNPLIGEDFFNTTKYLCTLQACQDYQDQVFCN